MDFHKLSEDEIIEFLNINNQNRSNDIYTQAYNLFVENTQNGINMYTEPVIDLYIASDLKPKIISSQKYTKESIYNADLQSISQFANLMGLSIDDINLRDRVVRILTLMDLIYIPENSLDLNFGIIFHWGLYSVPAYDDIISARRRHLKNGSEWYLARLLDKGNFRPISGSAETKQHHIQYYNNMPYSNFAISFSPTDPTKKIEEWLDLVKSVGASYAIITSKHHEGFCLWPTKSTNYHSKWDILKIFKDAANKRGLSFGIYYSWSEFDKSCTMQYINNVVVPQIYELIQYKPDTIFFDGHWCLKSAYAISKTNELVDQIKAAIPNIRINDRLGGKDFDNPNFLGKATYRNYSDRTIPNQIPQVPWEHINTIGLSWGRNKWQQPQDYKNGSQLLELYKNVVNMNGKFLLNLGPDENGNLDPYEVKSLTDFSNMFK